MKNLFGLFCLSMVAMPAIASFASPVAPHSSVFSAPTDHQRVAPMPADWPEVSLADFGRGKRTWLVAQAAPDAPPASSQSSTAQGQQCGDDPQGDASGALDVVQVCAQEVGPNLEIRITCAEAPQQNQLASYNIFIDTDGNEDTGLKTGLGAGADRLVQGAFVYKFAGANTSEWKWDRSGSATVEIQGKTIVTKVAKVALNPTAPLRLWIGTQKPDFSPADWAPQSGALALGGEASQSQGKTAEQKELAPATPPPSESKSAAASTPTPTPAPTSSSTGASQQAPPPLQGDMVAQYQDAEGDAAGALDIRSVEMATQGDKLIVRMELAGTPPLQSLHIFVNADGKDDTGYTDGAHPGAEFMVEGTTFYIHKPDVGTGWGWDASGTLAPAPLAQGRFVTFAIPRSRIGLTSNNTLTFWFATTDASWQTADTAPDQGGWSYPTNGASSARPSSAAAASENSPAEKNVLVLRWYDNIADAQRAAAESNKRILLFFYLSNNERSRALDNALNSPTVAPIIADKYVAVRLNFAENTQLARSLGVFKGGVINLYDSKGTPLGQIADRLGPEELAQKLKAE